MNNNYKCKIPVQIGHRLDYVHNERALENRTPVLKHIVVNPADPSDDLFKLCCLIPDLLKIKQLVLL